MKNCYDDILRLTSEAPRWFDEYAVPRFCDFSPRAVANIYAKECCLCLIRCQQCHREFKVAFSWHLLDGEPNLAKAIQTKQIHYGDPPNIGCCDAGPTMNSEPLHVLEYWLHEREPDYEWVRHPELEVSIEDE